VKPSEGDKRLEELFHTALERDPSDRHAFLDDACKHDPSLKARLVSLLSAHGKAPDFPDKPAWTHYIDDMEKGRELEEIEPEADLPYERLGEYRLIRKLGEGGMGVVYLAVQGSLNRLVALKVMRSERLGSFEAQARFVREVEAIAELSHPNIVTVYGSGEDKGTRFYAMEYLRGKGLDELQRENALPEERRPVEKMLVWIKETADALACVHKAGIIHRDVKPSNILVTPEGRAVLTDFGVARHARLSTLTLTGEFRGTPHYASPEQIRAQQKEIDLRTDVYSLGVTLYEIVSGRVPFEGETTEQVFHKILQDEPVPPSRINPAVQRDLETIVITAMEKDPERRYQGMAEMAEDLRRFLANEAILAKPAGLIRRSTKWIDRHRFFSLAAAAALMILIFFGVLFLNAASKKRSELRLAGRLYKPISEAMELPAAIRPNIANFWIFDADPLDPSGYIIRGLVDLDDGNNVDAAEYFVTAVESCVVKQDDALKREALYLLGIAEYRLGNEAGADTVEGKRLIAGAVSSLREAGEVDYASNETLVLRDFDGSSAASMSTELAEIGVKLNPNHFVVHIYTGLRLFDGLYKGGKPEEFEKTVNCFTSVLSMRKQNRAARTFLGRVYFFIARFYQAPEYVEKALYHLGEAGRYYEENRYYMIDATLAQIALLQGNNEKAIEYSRRAIKQSDDENDHIHNANCAMSAAYVKQGRLQEALEELKKASAIVSFDVNMEVAKGELFLIMGDLDKALLYAGYAKQRFTGARPPEVQIVKKSELAAGYLLCARIHLEKSRTQPDPNLFLLARENLKELFEVARYSPRDYCQACLLALTFPEELLWDDEQETRLHNLARTLAGQAHKPDQFNGENSPLFLTAKGVNSMLDENHAEAVRHFKSAVKEREKRAGSESIFHGAEDARDYYLMAVSDYRASSALEETNDREDTWKEYYLKAEELYERHFTPYLDYADIIRRIRDKAREVLPVD